MKASTLAVIAALASASALTACEDYYGYGGGYYPYGPYADVDYTGYYDGYYGPFYGGYWGPEGYFYFSDRDGRRFRRDDGQHFRRQSAQGFQQIRGHAPPARPAQQQQRRNRPN